MSSSKRASKETAWSAWAFDQQSQRRYRARLNIDGNWIYEYDTTSHTASTSSGPQYSSNPNVGSSTTLYTDPRGSQRRARFDPDTDGYAGSSNLTYEDDDNEDDDEDNDEGEDADENDNDTVTVHEGGRRSDPNSIGGVALRSYRSSINTATNHMASMSLSGRPTITGDNHSDTQDSDNEGSVSVRGIGRSVLVSTEQGSYASVESFDPEYRVHKSNEFRWGRVFKVLWAQPGSEDPFDSVHQIRRFVIINQMDGHCIALPIINYTKLKPMKPSQQKSHAIIFTSDEAPEPQPEEKRLLQPIRILPINRRQKLDSAARLNYAKLYTIEHNVKVWFIGQVHPKSEHQLVKDYNSIHQLLPDRRKTKPRGGTTSRQHPSTSYETTASPSLNSHQQQQTDFEPQGTTMYTTSRYPPGVESLYQSSSHPTHRSATEYTTAGSRKHSKKTPRPIGWTCCECGEEVNSDFHEQQCPNDAHYKCNNCADQ